MTLKPGLGDVPHHGTGQSDTVSVLPSETSRAVCGLVRSPSPVQWIGTHSGGRALRRDEGTKVTTPRYIRRERWCCETLLRGVRHLRLYISKTPGGSAVYSMPPDPCEVQWVGAGQRGSGAETFPLLSSDLCMPRHGAPCSGVKEAFNKLREYSHKCITSTEQL